MKHYLNTNKLAKSFVLAGVLSVGVIAGGQFTAAAGPDKAKMDPVKAVQVESSLNVHARVKATPAVPTQSRAEGKAAIQPKEKANNGIAQASAHASETAKIHANENSAVLGKSPKDAVEEAKTEEVTVKEPKTETANLESDVTVKAGCRYRHYY